MNGFDWFDIVCFCIWLLYVIVMLFGYVYVVLLLFLVIVCCLLLFVGGGLYVCFVLIACGIDLCY